jgi:hypothetical protein
MTTDTKAPRKRGRPAASLDNRAVRQFLVNIPSEWEAHTPGAVVCDPWALKGPQRRQLEDVLTGAVYLQSEGQASTRPLARPLLLRVLQRCDTITSKGVSEAIGRDYSRATFDRYMAVARVASKAIAALLERHAELNAYPTGEPGIGSDFVSPI